MEILLAKYEPPFEEAENCALSEVHSESIEIHDQRIQHLMLREASGQATRPWKKKEEGQPFAVNKNRPNQGRKCGIEELCYWATHMHHLSSGVSGK